MTAGLDLARLAQVSRIDAKTLEGVLAGHDNVVCEDRAKLVAETRRAIGRTPRAEHERRGEAGAVPCRDTIGAGAKVVGREPVHDRQRRRRGALAPAGVAVGHDRSQAIPEHGLEIAIERSNGVSDLHQIILRSIGRFGSASGAQLCFGCNQPTLSSGSQ